MLNVCECYVLSYWELLALGIIVWFIMLMQLSLLLVNMMSFFLELLGRVIYSFLGWILLLMKWDGRSLKVLFCKFSSDDYDIRTSLFPPFPDVNYFGKCWFLITLFRLHLLGKQSNLLLFGALNDNCSWKHICLLFIEMRPCLVRDEFRS